MMSELGGIVIGIVVAVGVYVWGRLSGRKHRREDQLKRNAEAHDRARRVDNEMDGRSNDDVTDWLRKRSGR